MLPFVQPNKGKNDQLPNDQAGQPPNEPTQVKVMV